MSQSRLTDHFDVLPDAVFEVLGHEQVEVVHAVMFLLLTFILLFGGIFLSAIIFADVAVM